MDRNRVILVIVIALLIVGGVGFLVIRSLNARQKVGPVSLEFWGTFETNAAFEEAINAFQKANPRIQVHYKQLPYQSYESTLINAFAANNGPDVFMMQNTWLPKYLDKVVKMPEKVSYLKDPLYSYRQFRDQFVDGTVADLTRNDSDVYGMPLYMDSLALYYNKDMLNSAGIINPPKTWEEFVKDVPLLTKKDALGNITQSAAAIGTSKNINRSTDILGLLMLQSGARMTSDDFSEATFARTVNNLDVGKSALQFYTDFASIAKQDRYTWNDQQKYSVDAFAEGKAAMMFNYSHQVDALKARSSRLNFGIAPMPQPAKAPKVVNYANYWAVTTAKQSLHPEEAWQFLVYLTTTDATSYYVNAAHRPSARKDYLDQQKANFEYGIFADQALTARSWYQVDPVRIENIFAKMIDDVNYNRSGVPEALHEAESQVTLLMKEAQR